MLDGTVSHLSQSSGFRHFDLCGFRIRSVNHNVSLSVSLCTFLDDGQYNEPVLRYPKKVGWLAVMGSTSTRVAGAALNGAPLGTATRPTPASQTAKPRVICYEYMLRDQTPNLGQVLSTSVPSFRDRQ